MLDHIEKLQILMVPPYNFLTTVVLAVSFYMGFQYLVFLLRYGELERKISQYPNLAELRAQMGDLLLKRKKYKEAKYLYETALSIHPDLHYARLQLAELFFQMGLKTEALSQLRELKKRTNDEKCLYGIKVTLQKWNMTGAV